MFPSSHLAIQSTGMQVAVHTDSGKCIALADIVSRGLERKSAVGREGGPSSAGSAPSVAVLTLRFRYVTEANDYMMGHTSSTGMRARKYTHT
jgi:hypothetical protein